MKKELKEKERLINESYEKIVIESSSSADLGSHESTEEYNKQTKYPICQSPLIYKDAYENYCNFYNKPTERIIKKYETLTCSNRKCNFNIVNNNKKDKIKEENWW